MKPSDFAKMVEAGVETAPAPVRTPSKPSTTPDRTTRPTTKPSRPWRAPRPNVSPEPKGFVNPDETRPYRHWDSADRPMTTDDASHAPTETEPTIP